MFSHTTYGFLTKSITPLAQDLSRILQIEWQERDSASYGDYYLYPPFQASTTRQMKERFTLYLNHIFWFEGWKVPRFKNCGVILTVTTERPLEIDMKIFSEFDGKVVIVERSVAEK